MITLLKLQISTINVTVNIKLLAINIYLTICLQHYHMLLQGIDEYSIA